VILAVVALRASSHAATTTATTDTMSSVGATPTTLYQPYVPPSSTPYVPPSYLPYVPPSYDYSAQYSVPDYTPPDYSPPEYSPYAPTGPTIPYPGNGLGPTQCADGTVSNSDGRGTCSWHGGEAG
jgi:hypothetical protein